MLIYKKKVYCLAVGLKAKQKLQTLKMISMKKKFFILTGALLTAALSAAIFARKPMTAEEALILRNVEAIAQDEDDYIRNEYGCIIWDTKCYGVIVTPGGNESFDIDNSRN